MRYKVLEGSESAHCCFCATVVDTHRPVTSCASGKPLLDDKGEPRHETICECFDMADAEAICAALNKQA